ILLFTGFIQLLHAIDKYLLILLGITIPDYAGHEIPHLRLLGARRIRRRQDSLRYLVQKGDVVIREIDTGAPDILIRLAATAQKSFRSQDRTTQQQAYS